MTHSENRQFIENIFNELKQLGAVRSTNDFSVNWLGMNAGYLHCLRSRDRQPSPRVLAHCSMRLRRASNLLTSVEQPPKVQKVAERMKELAEACAEAVFVEYEA
ncbi:DUF6626 family protein [Methylocystis sp. ATCC 49242]|uniref:DUF6626 family protein n=1 Tax=Methylocystis sp. ATCC 49242 TaxID=622637 RepID=UPI0001F86B24|nr:DUF6626 family protein [Methylocystis sp. ATCC 49242]